MTATTKDARVLSYTLYTLTDDLLQLVGALTYVDEDDTESHERLARYRQQLDEQTIEAVEAGIQAFRELKARGKAQKEEANRLLSLSHSHEHAADAIKSAVYDYMVQSETRRIDTATGRALVSKNGGAQPVEIDGSTVPEQVPERYQRKVVSIDMEAVRAGLLAIEEQVAEQVRSGALAEREVDDYRQKLIDDAGLGFARLAERGTHLRIS